MSVSSAETAVQGRKKKKPKEKKTLLQEIQSFILLFLAALAIVLAVDTFLFQFIRVNGSSMENTLKNGEILLVTKPGEYTRGEIVICRYPGRLDQSVDIGSSINLSRHTIFVKRLVALPGDSVEIRMGKLYVNDEWVPDPPNMGSVPRDYAQRTLGPDEYFVIGDNRFSSHDSRADDVGPISRSMLRGHVKQVIWPLGAFKKAE